MIFNFFFLFVLLSSPIYSHMRAHALRLRIDSISIRNEYRSILIALGWVWWNNYNYGYSIDSIGSVLFVVVVVVTHTPHTLKSSIGLHSHRIDLFDHHHHRHLQSYKSNRFVSIKFDKCRNNNTLTPKWKNTFHLLKFPIGIEKFSFALRAIHCIHYINQHILMHNKC